MSEQASVSVEQPPIVPENFLNYPYEPYSFIENPHLRAIHESTVEHCIEADELTVVRWLHSLSSPSSENYQPKFGMVSDDSVTKSGFCGKQLREIEALHVYTAARAENLLRILSVRDLNNTDYGVSRITSNALAKISNVYVERYHQHDQSPHLLLLAHGLAMYAVRFKEPDRSGYRQGIGHWLHLEVNVDLPWHRSEEEMKHWEERLRLAIALSELGIGAQASYVGKCLVPDLVQVYELTDQQEKLKTLKSHFENIPIVKEEPGIWFAAQHAAQQVKS